MAELETDGLLEEGEEAAPEEDPTRQAEGSAPDLDPVGVAPGEEGQTAGPAVAGEGDRRDGGGEEEFVEEVWQAILDPDSGEHYYWNTQTLETTWDKPRTIKRRRAGNLARASPDEREGGSAVTGHVESGEAGQGSEAEEHLRGGATQPESPCPIETGGEEASEAGPKFGKKESRPLEEPRTGEGADILNAEPSEEDALQAERSSLAIDGGAAPQARSSDDEMLALANQKKVVEAGASSDEASDSGDASEASDSEDRMEANGRAAGAGEAGLRAGEKASAETKQREQEPVGDPGSTLWDERRANEEPSSEQKVLVSGLLEEGEAQVRRLRERAG